MAQDKDDYATRLKDWDPQSGEAKPVEQRCLTSDATVEKIGELLDAGNQRVLTVHRDELSGLILGIHRYRKQATGDRQFYIQGYSGGP
jgi:hypothetical protein